MRKGDSYQGFWKSAKTENRIHGHEALEIADELRRLDFHEYALPYAVSVGQHPFDPESWLSPGRHFDAQRLAAASGYQTELV